MQILISLSTSDYLVNSVILAIVKNLQIAIDYLHEKSKIKPPNPIMDEKQQKIETENTAHNCIHLCSCIESIVHCRLLSNYTPLSDTIKTYLNKFLNTVFINLTQSHPIIAIQASKVIQLLCLNSP